MIRRPESHLLNDRSAHAIRALDLSVSIFPDPSIRRPESRFPVEPFRLKTSRPQTFPFKSFPIRRSNDPKAAISSNRSV
jgi:hypothetical protein